MRVASAFIAALACAPTLAFAAVSSDGVKTLDGADGNARTSLRFEKNEGQADSSAMFVARTRSQTVEFERDGVRVEIGSAEVAVRFAGAAAEPVAELAYSGTTNYILGSDPSGWRTGIPTFRRVREPNVAPGVDAVWTGEDGRLRCDLEVSPGADLASAAFSVEGTSAVRATTDGDLEMRTQDGRVLALAQPHVRDGGAAERVGRFRVEEDGRVRVSLADEDAGARAGGSGADAVDVNYFVYLGGQLAGDVATGVTANAEGHAYVTGYTISPDFPTTSGSYTPHGPAGQDDVYVAELNENGTDLVFATYFGGTDLDIPQAIVVDAAGAVYVAGYTRSTDLPLAGPAAQATLRGTTDAFVAKFNSAGSALLYSTYLGGDTDQDFAFDIAVGDAGRAYVVGNTASPSFPTTPSALMRVMPAASVTAFVSVIDTQAPVGAPSLVYSTFFGGSVATQAFGVAASGGHVYVTGDVEASDMPVTEAAYQARSGGGADGFLLELDPARAGGAGIVYSTYLGGESTDIAQSLALHDGLVYITGWTTSNDFGATPNAYRAVPLSTNGFPDGFLLVLDPTKPFSSAASYGTYFGGTDVDIPRDIAVDASGSAWVCGITNADDFPTSADAAGPNAFNGDGFVVEISPRRPGSAGLVYGTYTGGRASDEANDIAVDAKGGVFVVGDGGPIDIASTPTEIPNPVDGLNAFVLSLRAPTTDLALSAGPLTPNPAPRGQTASVTYTMTNTGSATATDATLTLTLPAGVTIVSIVDGNGAQLPVPSGTGDVRIATFDLAPGASASYTVTLAIPPSAGATVTVAAHVSTSVIDLNSANDTASEMVPVLTYPKIFSVKASKDGPFRIVIAGADFEAGAQVFIGDDPAPWPAVKQKGSTKLTLKGAGLKQRFPKRTSVTVKVVNPDGGSAVFAFVR